MHDVEISTDAARLDVDWIHAALGETYWARGIPRDVVERSLEGAIAFGAYQDGRQVGVARVVTDRATFAWIADVFVDPSARGCGVGKRLMDAIVTHPELQGLRRWLLATKDAHGLYEQFGFRPVRGPARFMEIAPADPYGVG
jgi:GNAT superfamily N-acetyltransferase